MEDVTGTKSSNHGKETKLPGMKGGLSGKTSGDKVDSTSGRLLVKAEEALNGNFVMKGENRQLGNVEKEGREPTEEDRFSITSFNPQSCCWV